MLQTLLQKLLVVLVVAVCIGQAMGEESSDHTELEKRGGARPFYGFNSMPGSKRLSDVSPYYFYQKRGGGRAFVGWSPMRYADLRLERRGGGRAFAGSYSPSDFGGYRFYSSPYFNKRSSNLWEYLQSGGNEF